MSGESILLVEDNDAVALGLQMGLQRECYQVTRAASVGDARTKAHEADFHLFILDIRLPDGSGFDLCREMRASGLKQPILILTARAETADKVIGLELGADDYITKPFELHELVARIRALLRRSYGSLAEGESSSHVDAGEVSLDLTRQRVYCRGSEIHLTSTEFRLLAFLVRHPGQAFDRTTLVRRLWSEVQLAGDNRTVDVHIRNLRNKIEVDPARPRLIITVRSAGYMFAS